MIDEQELRDVIAGLLAKGLVEEFEEDGEVCYCLTEAGDVMTKEMMAC